MGKLILNNMKFYGYHGVGAFEKDNGGQFEVDLEMDFDMSKAMKSDSIKDTVDYTQVHKLIRKVIENRKYNLLEALAGNILHTLFKEIKVDKAKVYLRKKYVPVEGVFDSVEVEVESERGKLNL
ncbi:MAG: dihydroneopterin aldolase [Candidatus Marinimicrobia bacterium]|nr:dihydroneopterin aldolase [Candidatus Neomarinimicrobiota bacterium]